MEALKDDRAGQHSMRINDRYRLCFVWEKGGRIHEGAVRDYGAVAVYGSPPVIHIYVYYRGGEW